MDICTVFSKLRCLESGPNQARRKIKDLGFFQKLFLPPGLGRTWNWGPAVGRSSGVGRQEASNQAAWGWGSLATWTQVRLEEGTLSETHTRHLLKQQFPNLLKVIALQECLANPVTERPRVRPGRQEISRPLGEVLFTCQRHREQTTEL